MYGQYRKADPTKIKALKDRGLSLAQIARQLGVSIQVVHYALRKRIPDPLNAPDTQRESDGQMSKRPLSKVIVLFIALFAMAALVPLARGQSGLRPLPPILSTISDEVGVLTVPQGQTLAKTLADIERETGVTIVVAILTTTRPESTETYVQRLINRWRRESKRLDRGRFVFVAVAKEDRELRIVPSKPLGWVLKQLAQGEVAEQAPALLKQDKYFEALTAIAEELSRLIAGHDVVVLRWADPRRLLSTTLMVVKTRQP